MFRSVHLSFPERGERRENDGVDRKRRNLQMMLVPGGASRGCLVTGAVTLWPRIKMVFLGCRRI